jgi:hypothetical protein
MDDAPQLAMISVLPLSGQQVDDAFVPCGGRRRVPRSTEFTARKVLPIQFWGSRTTRSTFGREFCFDKRWFFCTMFAGDSPKSRCYAEVTATSRTVMIAVRRHISALNYSSNGCRACLVQRRVGRDSETFGNAGITPARLTAGSRTA